MRLLTNWEKAKCDSSTKKSLRPHSGLPFAAISSLTGCNTTEILGSKYTNRANSLLNARVCKMVKQNEARIKKVGKDDKKQRCCHEEVQAAAIPRGVGRLLKILTKGGGRSSPTTWEASGEGGRGPDCVLKGERPMEQLLNEREYDFLAYMQGGAEPKEEDKLEFQILAAQILKAWDQCCNDYSVTYNEFMVLSTLGADYLLRGRVWSV